MNPSLIWWVLFLPVIGFLVQAFFGKSVIASMGPAAGRRVMGTLAVLPIAIAFVLGCVVTSQLATCLPRGGIWSRRSFPGSTLPD